MKFKKYHALGNDYIVIAPGDIEHDITPQDIRRICHRNYGIGADGILIGPTPSETCDYGVQIFNPDGSPAEKSGNGLRIFARALWDEGCVSEQPFTVETAGGPVTCRLLGDASRIAVEMGPVSFHSEKIPVTGPPREVINETIHAAGSRLTFCAATVGNPHCIVFMPAPSRRKAITFGPTIETDQRFPNRTNVQFVEVVDRSTIRIEIWERGAGYTLASGSSSTAAAAAAHKLGLCDSDISVQMPGGLLQVHLDGDMNASLTGPVTSVCTGEMSPELLTYIHPASMEVYEPNLRSPPA